MRRGHESGRLVVGGLDGLRPFRRRRLPVGSRLAGDGLRLTAGPRHQLAGLLLRRLVRRRQLGVHRRPVFGGLGGRGGGGSRGVIQQLLHFGGGRGPRAATSASTAARSAADLAAISSADAVASSTII